MTEDGLFSLPSKDPSANLLILVGMDREETYRLVEDLKEDSSFFSFLAIDVEDWNRDLSPWPSGKVFHNGSSFSGQADSYQNRLLNDVLPRILKENTIHPKAIGMLGYSLAGLFSLYSAILDSRISFIASVSGSFWYPGFVDFLRKKEIPKSLTHAYLSLGDKECNVRNPVLKTVEERTLEAKSLLEENNVVTFFEKNPGNHFQDSHERILKAVFWLQTHLQQKVVQ